jgi:hypothetical protein
MALSARASIVRGILLFGQARSGAAIFETSLPGSARGELASLGEQEEAKQLHLRGWLGQHGQSNSLTVCRWRTIMITKALRNNRSVYTRGLAGPPLVGGGGTGRWSTSWTRVTSTLVCPSMVGTSTFRLWCGSHDDVVVAASRSSSNAVLFLFMTGPQLNNLAEQLC